MKKISFLLLFLIGIYARCLPQSISLNPITATQAANYLCGNGIHPSNATFTGDGSQLFYFTNAGSTMPIASGIGITTGGGGFAAGKNTYNSGDALPFASNTDTPEDPDLQSLQSGNQFGTAYLEFDFTAEDITAFMSYSFASDEYNIYANSAYHDQMGIFLSGGTLIGTSNIATIGAGSNVSVNTINACTASNLYINNCLGNSCPGTRTTDPCPFHSLEDRDFPYNGCTKELLAGRILPTCSSTSVYHIKIAICNIADQLYDSGIFLKQGSFSTPNAPGIITASPSPVCDGTPVTLSYIPQPGGNTPTHYDWNTGQSGGTSLSSITIVADKNNPVHTVSVTAGACPQIVSLLVTIHTNSNTPPYVNGVDNTGEYTIYNAFDQNGCVSIPSFDTPNEAVSIFSPNCPTGSTFGHDFSQQQIGTFCYGANTGYIGVSTFSVNTIDNNACGFLNSTSTFTVKTICGSCYVDIYYQNRTPSNNPLPSFTKAGRMIIAGNNVDPNNPTGDVETGTADVEFKSSNIITLSPGFTAGPGFWAHIDPNTCINDCQDCCDRFTGFTHQAIPNRVTPNGDGVNDIWQLTDYEHQLCAYNATSFDLIIKNSWGNTVYHQSSSSTGCCPFRSASPSRANGVLSSIYWKANDVKHGTYFYILTLSGCNSSENFKGFIQVDDGGDGFRMANPDTIPDNDSTSASNQFQTVNGDGLRPSEGAKPSSEDENLIMIYPNPAKDATTIFFKTNLFKQENETAELQMTDVLGLNVMTKQIPINQDFIIPVKDYKAGSYIVRIRYNSFNFTNTLIITP